MIYYTLETIILGLVIVVIVLWTMLAEEQDRRRQREAWDRQFIGELNRRVGQ